MKKHFIGDIKLTSVKILEDKYNRFKEYNINRPMTLQRLVNRSMIMYMMDDDFRNRVDQMDELKVSGSSL